MMLLILKQGLLFRRRKVQLYIKILSHPTMNGLDVMSLGYCFAITEKNDYTTLEIYIIDRFNNLLNLMKI